MRPISNLTSVRSLMANAIGDQFTGTANLVNLSHTVLIQYRCIWSYLNECDSVSATSVRSSSKKTSSNFHVLRKIRCCDSCAIQAEMPPFRLMAVSSNQGTFPPMRALLTQDKRSIR